MNVWRWLMPWFWLAGWALPADAVDEKDLLDPKQAFMLAVTARDAHTLVAEWNIADGYYLYRERFKFVIDTPGVSLGDIRFPPGKLKEDEFFGKMETYRHRVAVEIPIIYATAPAAVKLKTVAQGCADLGVCYPPQTDISTVALGAAPAAEPAASPLPATAGPLNALLTGKPALGSDNPDLLDPKQAFIVTVTARDGQTLMAQWQIAEGYYLYRKRLSFTAQTTGVSIGEPRFPAGLEQEDEYFGKSEIYRGKVSIEIPLERAAAAPLQMDLKVGSQGCADAGVCYPPQTEIIPVQLVATAPPAALPAQPTDAVPPRLPTGGVALTATPIAEQDVIANMLVKRGFWALPAFFGFGLLLAFTPCMLPMVPILSSIIVGQGANLGGWRAFSLSATYVLAMAFAYTAAGIAAALAGQNIQAWFQHPVVIILFSTMFMGLGLAMFGAYNLQLPVALQNRLLAVSNRQRSGKYLGVAMMGVLSALIVGPCVAAPLIGVFTVIAASGDARLGGAALFVMSLGMGAPLLIIGASAGKLLPKAGLWMGTVKAGFGVMLFAVALAMLERILPEVVSMLLWAVFLIVVAVALGALGAISAPASAWRIVGKGVGVVLLVYGVLLLVGVAAGGRDTLQPLRGLWLASGGTAIPAALPFQRVKSVADLEARIRQANGKPLMLDFYADWCVSCKEMEKYTFSDATVRAALAAAVLLQADVTANDSTDRELLRRLGIIGPPAILFFDGSGAERPAYRVVGFLAAERFRARVAAAFASS